MTRDQFTDFLRDPASIANFDGDKLQQLVADYPYCQPLRILQLKQLKLNNSIQYSSRLKETAAYSPDRVQLYQVLNNKNKATSPVKISAFPELVENTINQQPTSEEVITALPFIESPPVNEISAVTTETLEEIKQETIVEDGRNNATTTVEVSPEETIVNRLKELNLWEDKTETPEETLETTSNSNPSDKATEIVEQIIEDEIKEIETAAVDNITAQEADSLNSTIENQKQEDHNTLVSGYLESITQSNELISPLANKQSPSTEPSEETAVLSFTEWLKRKNFPHEEPVELAPTANDQSHLIDDDSTPVIAKLLYLKEGANENEEDRKEQATPITNSTNIIIAVPTTPIPMEAAPIQPGRTLRTNEELGLKEVIRPIKKGRAAERKNKNKTEDKTADAKPITNPDYQSKIIDRFIEEEPRITPVKAAVYNPMNMARKSTIQPDDLITETLAMIYAQQGNIEKAIEFYGKLSLKFPEKSVYFASLIQELKNKQNQ